MPKNREKKTKQTVDKEVNKKLRKEGLEGPRSRFSVRVSATVGKLGPNHAQGPELQVASFLHPALMKEPNDGTNFGPLQAAAAQWGLWRISSLSVRFTPLVGASAVTGSVYRASLNLTQSPGNANWGGLGARNHIDIPVGRSTTWKLKRGDFNGPRQTWWMTDTNEEGGQSAGPMLEVHGLGKTTSTYQDRDWTGDLFIVEVDGRWEFTNYNSKPALGTLDRKTEELKDTKAPSMAVGSDGILTMSIPNDTRLARFMSDAFERNAPPEGSVGETIWQVVDEGVGLASSVTPVPFNWLIRSGWWFIKKIAGRSSNAATTYQVFASLADAQNNKPVIAEPMASTTAATTLTVTQINAPNVGPSDTRTNFHAGVSPYPLIPSKDPPPARTRVLITARGRPFKINYDAAADTSIKACVKSGATKYLYTLRRGNDVSYVTSAYKLRNVRVLSLDDQDQITGCYDPGWLMPTGISLYPLSNTTSAIGRVLAYDGDNFNSDSAPFSCAVWFVQITRDVAGTVPTDLIQHHPGAYLAAGSSVTPPIQATINKLSVPALNRTGNSSVTPCKTHIPALTSNDYLLVYSVGKNKINEAGFTNTAPLAESDSSENAQQVDQNHTTDIGFWANALSTSCPTEDRVSVVLRTAQQRSADSALVDKIMLAIQQRFNLSPAEDSESESEGEDSQSDDESETENCTEEPTPPQPAPRVKLAKEMMYEALRESDWTHVDADALIAAFSKELNTARGHAE